MKQTGVRTIKTGRRQRGASVGLLPHLKSVCLFHVWLPGCCIHPILYLKTVAPLWLLDPRSKILATGLNTNKKILLRTKTCECAQCWVQGWGGPRQD